MADKETKDSKAEAADEKDQKPADKDKAEASPEPWKPSVPNSVVHIKGW